MDKYIGIDVHARSCTVAVIDGVGKRVGHHVSDGRQGPWYEFDIIEPQRPPIVYVHPLLVQAIKSSLIPPK